MKKLSTLAILVAAAIAFQSSVKKGTYSSVPPSGYTGASGSYCVDCHSSYALNSGGGSIATTGLPTGTYTAGQAYNFSLTISHPTSRSRWSFSIAAVNANGNTVGTFTSTNANAANNSGELSHNGAVSSTGTTYTYNNLRWTAPTNPTNADKNITFYYVGNAANGNGSTSLDYIYSGSKALALPVALKDITATVQDKNVVVAWQTSTEINTSHFEIEKSDNAQTFYTIGKVDARGNSTTTQSYEFTDSKPSVFNAPVSYRLKMVDKDGSFQYSKVVTAVVKATKVFVNKAYPTILTAGRAVNAEVITDKKQDITVRMVDMNGRMLESFVFHLNEGSNMINFKPSANLSKGWVFAQFSGAGLQQTISLMVE